MRGVNVVGCSKVNKLIASRQRPFRGYHGHRQLCSDHCLQLTSITVLSIIIELKRTEIHSFVIADR